MLERGFEKDLRTIQAKLQIGIDLREDAEKNKASAADYWQWTVLKDRSAGKIEPSDSKALLMRAVSYIMISLLCLNILISSRVVYMKFINVVHKVPVIINILLRLHMSTYAYACALYQRFGQWGMFVFSFPSNYKFYRSGLLFNKYGEYFQTFQYLQLFVSKLLRKTRYCWSIAGIPQNFASFPKQITHPHLCTWVKKVR